MTSLTCPKCKGQAEEYEGTRICSGCNAYFDFCDCPNQLPIQQQIEERIEKKGTIKMNIIQLMKNDEECRNDDAWLQFRYARDIMGADMNDFKEWKRIPSLESIRRIRQMVQNTAGLFLPTRDEVVIQRRIEQTAVRRWYLEEKYIYGLNNAQMSNLLLERDQDEGRTAR